MREILINLDHAASLGTLATPAGGAAALPAGMPVTAGIYLIVNTGNENRYAGISTNVARRFVGRMSTVTEFGLETADVAHLWAWWGNVRTREVPIPQVFPYAFPTALAGLPLQQRYAFPGVAASVRPLGAALPTPQTAQDEVLVPIRAAIAAYRAFQTSAAPRTAATVAAAWNLVFAANPGLIAAPGFAQLAAVAVAHNATDAAEQVAILSGMPPLASNTVAVAIHQRSNGFLPPASDCARAVDAIGFAGPALQIPAPYSVMTTRNPVGPRPTRVNHIFTTGAPAPAIDLEHVFIRFVLNHLAAVPIPVSNGAKTAAIPWPGGNDPICVTWHSIAGGTFGPFDRTVVWWPNHTF